MRLALARQGQPCRPAKIRARHRRSVDGQWDARIRDREGGQREFTLAVELRRMGPHPAVELERDLDACLWLEPSHDDGPASLTRRHWKASIFAASQLGLAVARRAMTSALDGRAADALGTVDRFSGLEVQDRDPDVRVKGAVHPDHLDVTIDATDGLCAGFGVIVEAPRDDGPVGGQPQRRPELGLH
jgi:hypothetical protein